MGDLMKKLLVIPKSFEEIENIKNLASGFIIGIKKSESTISLMLIIGGAIVAMNTSMNREDKKNN